eukprot:3185136-Rhodomonas_salina.1
MASGAVARGATPRALRELRAPRLELPLWYDRANKTRITERSTWSERVAASSERSSRSRFVVFSSWPPERVTRRSVHATRASNARCPSASARCPSVSARCWV